MMNRYRETFSNRHVVLPVIHVESREQTLRNVEIAHRQGCDGVFLINHDTPYTKLLEIHHRVCEAFPDWWIGVNCLDLDPSAVFEKLTDEVAGVWADNAMIDERVEHQTRAEKIAEARAKSGWQGLYFGGVAFKYQRPVDDVREAARIAAGYMDIVTTSGPGTGQAAAPDKIRAMKGSLGTFPLAIASGITAQNVGSYLDTADCFLVATGISKSRSELDEELVKGLLDEIACCPGRR
jgi:predicted TIM-barrel enzyme